MLSMSLERRQIKVNRRQLINCVITSLYNTRIDVNNEGEIRGYKRIPSIIKLDISDPDVGKLGTIELDIPALDFSFIDMVNEVRNRDIEMVCDRTFNEYDPDFGR
jgi:hypothetical protein